MEPLPTTKTRLELAGSIGHDFSLRNYFFGIAQLLQGQPSLPAMQARPSLQAIENSFLDCLSAESPRSVLPFKAPSVMACFPNGFTPFSLFLLLLERG